MRRLHLSSAAVVVAALSLSCRPTPPPMPTPMAPVDDADARLERALLRLGDVERGVPRLEEGQLWWSERGDDGRSTWSRRTPVAGSPTEVVLDERTELPSTTGVDVGVVDAAPGHAETVAYTADLERADRYRVRVKNLPRKRTVEVADDADFSLAWGKDGGLYFTRFGTDERPRSLWRVEAEATWEPVLVHRLDDVEPGELVVADVDGAPEVFHRSATDDIPVRGWSLGGGDDVPFSRFPAIR